MRRTFGRIVSKLRQDNFALLVCVGLSLTLWLVIQLSKTYDQAKTVYLEYQVPMGITLTQWPPREIEATVKETGWNLLGSVLHQNKYTLSVDLQAYRSRIIEREELIQMLSQTLGMPVVDVNRNYLLFSLDSAYTKVVPVLFDNRITLAKDFFLTGQVVIVPDSVTLSGPRADLAKISSVSTYPVTLSNIKKTLTTEVELIPPASEQVLLDRKKVLVTVPVEQFTEAEFNIAIRVPDDIGDYFLVPKSVNLKCIVQLAAAQNISADEFVVGVVESEIGKDPYSAFVPLELVQKPPYVRGIRLSQNSVELFLIK